MGLGVRVQAYMAILPVCGVLLLTLLEHRREPMEIFMDRETYWKDADSYMWGVYFDHHHFSHQLCHRRAHKWGYHGQDYTLEGGHHWNDGRLGGCGHADFGVCTLVA